jgi:ankyrin repeat protein
MSMSSKKKTSGRLATTPLMRAAVRGHEATVRKLLVTDQHTLNFVCENGKTALGFAVAAGRESVADMLIAAGADVNLTLPDDDLDEHRRMNSVPPMVAAAAKGHWSIVRKLIAANANVDAKCGHGLTTLFYAAAAGKLEIIKELVVAGANVTRSEAVLTPIGMAMHCAHTSVVSYLQIAAERPNAATATPHHTKLWFAVMNGDEEQVDELLAASGDNVNMVYADGSTLLDYAGSWPIVFKLIATKPQPGAWPLGEVLQNAAMQGELSAMAALLCAGADPTLECWKLCARFQRTFEVALLLAAGASVPARVYERGLCDFGLRSHQPNIEIASMLASAGVVIVTENPDLLTAIEDGKAKAVKTIELAGFRAIRARALEVCIALHNLRLSALEQTEILRFACTPFATYLPLHYLWNAVVTVKHFREPMK